MTNDEIIAVVQARKEGEEIDRRPLDPDSPRDWEPTSLPTWDFHYYEYQARPKTDWNALKGKTVEFKYKFNDTDNWFKDIEFVADMGGSLVKFGQLTFHEVKNLKFIRIMNESETKTTHAYDDTFEDAKEGDRVWCSKRGWGTVVSIDPDFCHSVDIDFDLGDTPYDRRKGFTFSGKFFKEPRTLFWSEPPEESVADTDFVHRYKKEIDWNALVGKKVKVEFWEGKVLTLSGTLLEKNDSYIILENTEGAKSWLRLKEHKPKLIRVIEPELRAWTMEDVLVKDPLTIRRKVRDIEIAWLVYAVAETYARTLECKIPFEILLQNYEYNTGKRDADGKLIWSACGSTKEETNQ